MKKKVLLLLPILIAIIAFVFVYRYYNKEDKTTTLTITEKRWVEENAETEFDFEIVNDYPLYGLNGIGVIFDFIEDFEENIGMEFNKISYLKNEEPTGNSYRIRILNNDEKLTSNDLFLFNDNYVIVGKTYERINHIQDIKNKNIGILKADEEELTFYLKGASNISLTTYEDVATMYTALDKDEINMLVAPNIMYLNYTIQKDKYVINYYMTEAKKQIVLTLSENETDKKLNTILTKYYNKWRQLNYVSEYNKEYLAYYLDNNKLDAKTKATLVSKNYVYGYVENVPYEKKVHGKVAGIAGEYIDRVSRLTDITFKYKKYSSVQALEKAVEKGEVDIYFDYYNYSNDEYLPTVSTFIEDFSVLGKQEDNHIVTSFESLKGQDIVMLENDALYSYFKSNSRAKIKTYKNIDELVRNAKHKIIVVDSEVYRYYQNNKFKKYKLLYQDNMMNDYKFMVKKDNEAFYNLFNYIINTNSYYNYRNSGIENLHALLMEDSTLEQVYSIVLAIIFTPLVIIGLIVLIIKAKNRKKKVKITDRHKYTDMLTSLKNRNYLNMKMQEWEDCEVFPQAIVMVDLNNVKYVNDNYGHEEGDQLIIRAAGILVNTQLENSEIVRTDGNEFLIYLVGYSERQISTYTKKLSKEMRNLPHEFGAAVGYSMITDEIKTLDDAINEATLEMITNKEEYK
ncbi:MAG: GGDEF domain-containing protein [Bacilli bacterium]|nr:GGDEF domain-containing protein [Bacilli bacterium]